MFYEGVRLTRYAARLFGIKVSVVSPNRLLHHLRLNHAMSSPESLSSDNVHKLLSDTNSSASSFIQSALTAVFQSSPEATGFVPDSSQLILDQLFSPNCEVRKDHVPQDLAEFKEDLVARRAGCRTANMKFEQIISTNDDKLEEVSWYYPWVEDWTLIDIPTGYRCTHM